MKQTILLMILFYYYAASLFMQFHVLIFHQSGCTVVYNVYMHVTEQRSEGSPIR